MLCSREKEIFTFFEKRLDLDSNLGPTALRRLTLPTQLGSLTDAVQCIVIYKYINTAFDIKARI